MRVAVPGLPPVDLGITETTPTVGITDYSRRVTDDFGVTTVVKRGFARRLSLRFAVPFESVDALQSRLADLRATKATWIADDRFRALSVAGIYKDFSIDVVSQPCSFCTLTVDGFAETLDYPDDGSDPAVSGASTFRLLQPVTVTDAVLRSSSVTEDDAAAWSANTTYAKGARVVDGHRVYESLIDGNVGNAPPSTQWLDAAPTNRWAMFDQALGSATTAADGMVVILSSAGATALALLDVTSATVRVQGAGYDQERVVDGTMIFDGLPAGDIVVSIGGAGTVAVGTLLFGRIVGLGVTETSPTAAITDYSRKDTDDFGDVTIVERAWAKRMSARTMFRTDALDLVFERIAMVRATPSLWIGDEGTEALSVYGFFKDFSIEVGETTAKLSLQIEGLSRAAKVAPLKAVADWPDLGDPDGTKPDDNADVTAENTSKDTAAVGGRPALDLLADVSALEVAKVGTDAALDALDRAAGDSRAALAQVERDAGRIGETLLRLLAESERTRTVLRDAGIVVDPTTGVVRIYAVDQIAERTASAEVRLDAATATISSKASVAYVQEQIALAVLDPGQAAQLEPIIARLTSAEQTISGVGAAVSTKADLIELTRVSGRVTTVSEDLDALAGTVSTKASRTDLDAQGARLGSVEETLSTLDGVSSFGVTVRQARAIADGAAEAGLRALLAGDQAHRWQIVQQAEARTEMFAKLADQSSAEAVARQVLSVQIGAADARGLQESFARIAGDEVLSTRIGALSATNGELAAAIGTLESASVTQGKGIAGIATTIRQQVADDDTTGEALLRALIAGDQTGRARAAQLVQVQTELSTTLVANEQAAAVARQSLLVRMMSAEAAIVTTSRALATLTQSIVERVSAAEAVIRDPATGLVATRAQMTEIDRLSVERDTSLGERIDVVSVSAGDATAAVAALGKVVTDGEAATAELIQQVSTTVDGQKSSVDFLLRAIDGEDAVAQLSVGAGGKITGFRVDGEDRVFAIDAERFLVGDSQIFLVDTVTGLVTIANAAIGTASIDTLNLKDGSVSGQIVESLPGFTIAMAGAATGTRAVDSEPITTTTTGKRLRIDVQLDSRTEVDARWIATIRLMRTTTAGTAAIGRVVPVATADAFYGWWVSDRVPPGPVTYFLRADLEKLSSGLAQIDFSSIQIAIEETKK